MLPRAEKRKSETSSLFIEKGGGKRRPFYIQSGKKVLEKENVTPS